MVPARLGFKRICTARDAADALAPLLDGNEERLLAVYLDEDGNFLGAGERAGLVDAIELPLREIVQEALNAQAAAIILAHNHPSGDPTPSAGDKQATKRLADIAAALGMAIRDHLVFAGGRCTSFRALGLL